MTCHKSTLTREPYSDTGIIIQSILDLFSFVYKQNGK